MADTVSRVETTTTRQQKGLTMNRPTPARDLSLDLKLYSYRTRRDAHLSRVSPASYGDYNGALAFLVEADNIAAIRASILSDLKAIVAELEGHERGTVKK